MFFVLTTLLVSCGSNKPVVVQNETKTITQTVHDTVFKIEKDSASLKALLECQNGKVVVKNIVQSEPGRTLKSPRVRIADNVLQVDCEARARELLAHYKNTHEAKILTVTKTIEVNKLTWWQQTQIKGFWGFMVILLLIVVYTVFKYNFKKLI
ncbi:hypothetical protein FEM08_13280 [Flavobacterium gilvum]|nr:hypothetical protein FEM08_13280 [Flavobacterium gilvum]